MRRLRFVSLLLVLAVSSCRMSEKITAPAGIDVRKETSAEALHSKRERRGQGAVFVQTNGAAGNAVLAYPRHDDGMLGDPVSHSTGGTGTGGGLGNQGGVVLSPDGRWLFVVNAGSNDITSFRVSGDRLRAVDRIGSGGIRPVSLTVHGNRLFVLNAGGEGNVAGFRVRESGGLERVRRWTRPLSGNVVMAAQIGFAPDGEHLVVTERATNRISVYSIDDGRLRGPNAQSSSGTTPFGFGFDRRGTLIVSEAFGGAPNGSAVSSYRLRESGRLRVVSGSVPTHQTAACWIAVSADDRFAYTTNAGSASITGYRIGSGGMLAPLHAGGVTAMTSGGPSDLAFGAGGRYLYVRSGGLNGINVFAWRSDGSLEHLGDTTGLPAGANGIAAN